MADKPVKEQARLWNRLASMVSQFETEHHYYHKFVFDGYDLKRYSIIKQQLLTSGKSNRKLPKIGREAVRAQSAGCLSREAGFDQASQTDEQTGSAKNSPERKPETRMSFKESQGGLPRYEDPGKKRFMKAV